MKSIIFRIAVILMVCFFVFLVLLPYGLNSENDVIVITSQIAVFMAAACILYEIVKIVQKYLNK